MLNYYTILGVQSNATAAEIKSAFKKLAIQHHPDKNPNDKNAEEQFKIINEAYQVLNDGYKKSIYDQKLFYREDSNNNFNNFGGNFDKNISNANYKKTYKTFRRRAYKNTNYDPRLHVIVFGGFILSLIFSWLIYRLIENHSAVNNYKEALQLYQNKQYEASFAKVHQAIMQDDSNVQAYYLRGILMSEYKKDRVGATYCFDRCIMYGQQETVKTPTKIGILPDFYFQRGLCYYAKNSFSQALADFYRVLKLDNHHEQALLLSGDIYLNKYNKTQTAYNYYAKLLKIYPNNEDALFSRAMIFYYTQRYSSAKEEFDKIIAKKPDIEKSYSGRAYYYLACIHLNSRDTTKDNTVANKKACENFKKAHQLGVVQADFFVKKLCKE